MRWDRLVLGLVVCLLFCGVAAAQGAPGRIVQGGDGSLYLLKDGARYLITVDAIDGDELSAYADGGTLDGAGLVAALGAPSDAAAPSARSVPPTVGMPAATDDGPPAADDAPPPTSVSDATVVAPPSAGTSKTSASGNAQAAAPVALQQPAGKGTRRGAPSLNFLKVQGAAPGGTATVSVQSTPGASCTLAYRTPAGSQSTAAGLGQQTADANGVASWSWLIDGNTKVGLGSISVNCGNLGITDTMQIGSSDGGGRR